MKTWENKTINGRNFEVNTKEVRTYKHIGYHTIADCYSRPSRAKDAIWCDWLKWFCDNDGYCTVASYNCNFFTIEGYFTDLETDERYYAYITASHNKCWKVA